MKKYTIDKGALAKAVTGLVALLLIGTGIALYTPPAALIVVGGLLWLDLTIEGIKRNRR